MLRGQFGHAQITLAERSPKIDDASNAQPAAPGRLVSLMMRLIRFLSALRAWATGHWLRSVIVASTILTLIGVTIGGWAYLASVALRAGELKIDAALAAYDKGNYEEARSLVTHMLTNGRLPRSEYGGPLFVL